MGTRSHTYQVAGLRLMLGVEVAAGNRSHANTTLPGLIELMERLPAEKRPHLVRGDAGAGGEPTMGLYSNKGTKSPTGFGHHHQIPTDCIASW